MKVVKLYIVPTKGTKLSFYDLMHKLIRENKGIPDDQIDDYLKSKGIILVRAKENQDPDQDEIARELLLEKKYKRGGRK